MLRKVAASASKGPAWPDDATRLSVPDWVLERLATAEILGPADRTELLGGEILVKEPQESLHATGIRLAAQALRRAFGDGWDVAMQLPIALDQESEPEPDCSVVPGDPRDYRDAHPARPALEQPEAEAVLEQAHLMAYGGGGDMELRGSALEAQMAGGGLEGTQGGERGQAAHRSSLKGELSSSLW